MPTAPDPLDRNLRCTSPRLGDAWFLLGNPRPHWLFAGQPEHRESAHRHTKAARGAARRRTV